MLDKLIQDRIKEWLGDDYDKDTQLEINKLVQQNNEAELTDRFYKELDFGTGGLRGVIGAGTNRMNIYTVGKSAQGIANYITKNEKDYSKGIVIAYDSRNFSDIFALRSGLIFAANGIKAYIFSSLRPTPILSFAIRRLNAIAGIVVTASHNPPEYNGYKVYYKDGGQVLPPHDVGIIDEVRAIKSMSEVKSISEKEAINKSLLSYIDKEVDEAYYKRALSLSINRDTVKQMSDKLKIVFTPLHGASNIAVRELLKRWGFNNVYVVKEQEEPDGNFPTVSYPNPEESKALELAIKLAKTNDSDIVLATDPDGDRVGTAIKHKNDFILLNGNQVGVIITYYLLSQYKAHGRLPKDSFVVKTIVSTDLTSAICDDFNVHQFEVLTGFKYIAEKIYQYHDLENKSKEYIFGFEESYGYLLGDFVRDKDAVSTCAIIAEVAALCKNKGITLIDYLDEIYKKYGFYLEGLRSLTLKGKEGVEQIQKIITHFRDSPPDRINNSKVIRIRDVYLGKTTDLTNGKEEPLDLPKSNVLTFYLEDNSKVTIRPSGTEPKIKFYFSIIKSNVDNLDNAKLSAKKDLDSFANNFVDSINALG